MKKRSLLIAILALCILPSSCGKESSSVISSSQESSSSLTEITKINVSGPSALNVGQTITLGIDVIGSDTDLVTITVSDPTIVSIDGTRITGLKEGNVTLTITSSENTSISTTKDIRVNSQYADRINVFIKDNDNVTYDESTNYYTIPLGQEFTIAYFVDEQYKQDFKVSYSVSYPSSQQDGNFSLTQNEDNTATCKAMVAYEGISVVLKVFYHDNTTSPDVTTSIQMHVVDNNSSNLEKAKQIIDNFDNDTLLSATIDKSLSSTYINSQTNNKETSISSSKVISNSYVDENYLTEIITDNDGTSTNNYYSTIYDNKYYVFEYNPSSYAILGLYANESNSSNKDASLFFSVDNDVLVTGIENYIGRFLSSSIEDSILLFADTNIYAYSNFVFNDNSFTITSIYTLDSNATYNLNLTINYSSNQVISYSFKETMTGTYESFEYEEKGSNFTYGTKDANTNKTIDMSKYFFTEDTFDTEVANDKDPDGKYDFSNPDKYFSGTPTQESDGTLTYSLATNQALALRIKRKDGSSTIATTSIDTFTMTSSDETIVEKSTMLSNSSSNDGSGIFVISAYKDSQGQIKTGKTTITLTSAKGVSYKFNVEFYQNALSEITVGGAYISDENNKFDLGEIYLNDISNNFTINGEPDDSSYTWILSNIEGGDSDGLELYHYEDGNIEGLYGYAIKGLKVGTYSFKIGCQGSSVVTTNTYTITVKDSYSIEKIESGIVGNTYTYKMGDSYTYTLYFETNTKAVLTQEISYESSSSSINLAYSIEKGRIVLNEQTLPDGFYYSTIMGDVKFNDDLSTLTLYLSYVSKSDEGVESNKTYTSVSFSKYVDKSDPMTYLKGKISTKQSNVPLEGKYQNYDFTLSFDSNSNSASITIVRHKDLVTIATITFEYSYSSKTTQFTLTNIVSTGDVTITDSNPYYNLNTSYGDYIDFTFTNSSKVRFTV